MSRPAHIKRAKVLRSRWWRLKVTGSDTKYVSGWWRCADSKLAHAIRSGYPRGKK